MLFLQTSKDSLKLNLNKSLICANIMSLSITGSNLLYQTHAF